MNKADMILKENEKLKEDNKELKTEMMTVRKEVDEKRSQLNQKQALLQKEENYLKVQKENLKAVIDRKVREKTIDTTNQLKETYEKRWKGKQHYLKGLLTYGVFVIALEAVKSKVFVQDSVTFFKVLIHAVCFLAKKDFELATVVAKVSEHISNHMAGDIVHWMLVCLICGASIFAIALIGKIAGAKVLNYYRENPMDYMTITAMMMNVAVMVFGGEYIKRIVPINLLLLLFVIQLIIEMVRSYVKGWKRARGLY